jgi:hypothetical protein
MQRKPRPQFKNKQSNQRTAQMIAIQQFFVDGEIASNSN